MSLCHCMGPQNGEPACPCEMKNLKQVDGRLVKVIDYGHVKENNMDSFDDFDDFDDFEQYTLVRLNKESKKFLEETSNGKHPLLDNEIHKRDKRTRLFVYLGEIPNMRGHCVVADMGLDGKVHAGYHTDNFEIVPDEDL